MLKRFILTAGVLAIGLAGQASAQDAEFNGPYVGGSIGYGFQSNDRGESILFDRGLDGSLDTVTTSPGNNAFAPGFCDGRATRTANIGCDNDRDDIEYHGRIGWDVSLGNVVVGVVGEFGKSKVRDSVSAFSTTPASYTMTRELDWDAGLRARLGYAFGGKTLFYGTGGGAYARIDNSFETSNRVNAFADNGKSDSWGWAAGGGVEQKLGSNVSFGLEYLYTRLNDDDYRVRVTQGIAPANNPFILTGAAGTEFRRSDPHFDYHAIRLTGAFRF